jgi:tRNA(Ile)-lysidine synthetase-like protein
MPEETVRERVEAFIRDEDLLAPGQAVTVLVSGGPDSTCLWHVLGALEYDVSAQHVSHRLRGEESEEDARLCREALGAEIVDGSGGTTEEELRRIRYGFATDRLRATGHTLSDQVETILYRLVTSGSAKGIKPKREDGVIRPLLCVWRADTRRYCEEHDLSFRDDTSNRDTVRGLIRDEVLPLLRRIHPAADANLLRALESRETMPPALAELLADPAASKRVDLGAGVQAVREYDRLWLERSPVVLKGEVRWGPWRIATTLPGLKVRTWRPGDRLAGRSKKIQDLFVDAKIPRTEREQWPLVVRGDEVVAVPGIVDVPGVEATRE